MSKIRYVTVTGVVLGIGVCWGILIHRNRVFPYSVIATAYRTILPGSVGAEASPDVHVDLSSRSPAFDALRTLPYVSGTYDSNHSTSGVLLHDPHRAFQGVTLYGPRGEAAAFLIDMDGSVVREWHGVPDEPWHHIAVLDDGGLLANVRGQELLRLDHASTRMWTVPGGFHHDFWIDDGVVWALSSAVRMIPEIHSSTPVTADRLTRVSLATGEVLSHIDLVDLVRRSRYAFLLPSVSHVTFADDAVLDPLHTNHVELFDGTLADRSELFAAGNLLLSMRALNAIVVVDGESLEIAWLWGPSTLTYQHHPSLLPNGNILIFNNGDEQSEVIELDPLTGRIVWIYTAQGFYSSTRGSAQRLPNGNTLITESNAGYVFEIGADGETVWEFANPSVHRDGIRQAIWRATRFTQTELPFLEHGGRPEQRR